MHYDCIFRFDAGKGIGLGHLRRCLALADAMRQLGYKKIGFVTRTPKTLKLWIKNGKIISLGAKSLKEEIGFWKRFLDHNRCRLVIIDSYKATQSYYASLRKMKAKVACFDDTASLKSYSVDAVINYNAYAKKLRYNVPENSKKILGLRYAPLNKEFLKSREQKKSHRGGILLCLGGSPKKEWLSKVKRGIASPEINVEVKLLGAKKSAARQMAGADLAITAAGVTSYELLFLGVPTVCITVARNQEGVAKALGSLGAVKNLGKLSSLKKARLGQTVKSLLGNERLRRRQVAIGRKLIDGRGAERIARALKVYMK